MITIKINADYIIQIHKNHVVGALTGDETLRFTESLTERVFSLTTYGFQALQNCYLLTIDTAELAQADADSRLDVVSMNNSVLYSSKVLFLKPQNEQF